MEGKKRFTFTGRNPGELLLLEKYVSLKKVLYAKKSGSDDNEVVEAFCMTTLVEALAGEALEYFVAEGLCDGGYDGAVKALGLQYLRKRPRQEIVRRINSLKVDESKDRPVRSYLVDVRNLVTECGGSLKNFYYDVYLRLMQLVDNTLAQTVPMSLVKVMEEQTDTAKVAEELDAWVGHLDLLSSQGVPVFYFSRDRRSRRAVKAEERDVTVVPVPTKPTNEVANQRSRVDTRDPVAVCEACGRKGHRESTCWTTHPELRPTRTGREGAVRGIDTTGIDVTEPRKTRAGGLNM